MAQCRCGRRLVANRRLCQQCALADDYTDRDGDWDGPEILRDEKGEE